MQIHFPKRSDLSCQCLHTILQKNCEPVLHQCSSTICSKHLKLYWQTRTPITGEYILTSKVHCKEAVGLTVRGRSDLKWAFIVCWLMPSPSVDRSNWVTIWPQNQISTLCLIGAYGMASKYYSCCYSCSSDAHILLYLTSHWLHDMPR